VTRVRIIYLHQYFNTPQMAGSTRSFEIGRRLVAAGHEVEMVTSWREPTATRAWFTNETAGMRVHWLPLPYSNHMTYKARTAAFLRFAVAAGRRAAALGGDVIYASSTPLTISLPGIYAAQRSGIPMVFEVRDLWPELPIAMGALRNPLSRALAHWLERFSYAHAARVVALSPGMAAGVARTGYSVNHIAVVPNGSDVTFFQRDTQRGRSFRRTLGIADERILVGYTGSFGRINGVRYLLDVAAELRNDQRFIFLLMGDGQESAQLRDAARRLGLLGSTVLMQPQVCKQEMPAVLSALDIATSLFLPIPAMESNSANKFFDALAAGCCVAINYGGWQADLLAAEGAGLRLAADPRTAALQLREYAGDRSRLESAGRNARRLAEDRFSFDRLATQVETVIIAAAGERNAQRRREERNGSP
jgi:glycosyltransferase involved in cell wall biosynthesis